MKIFKLSVLALLLTNFCQAQNGLEGIIVEKYYISEPNDTNANSIGGNLPVNSTTYRIYADMLPGYKFQAAFGLANQELRLETSTLFFNNADYGSTTPNYSKNNARKNTVMIDSYLSVGAACNGNHGILKSDDNGVSNAINNFTPQVLQSTNQAAGIPLTIQDGFIAGTPCQLTAVGITSEISVFDNATVGSVFSTYNGSWACLNGATGYDSISNKVLIAQLTTDGIFKFKLNIQIGTPSGSTEQYVAENPTANQIQLADLIFDSSLWTEILDSESNQVSSFKSYPTVVQSTLNTEILSDEKYKSATLEIVGIDGKICYKDNVELTAGKNNHQLDISYLSKGLYFINFKINNGASAQRKFIKQ